MTRAEFKRFGSVVSLIPAIGGVVAAFFIRDEQIEFIVLGFALWLFFGWAFREKYIASHRTGTFQDSDGSWPSDEQAEALRKLPADAPFSHFLWPFAKHTGAYQASRERH